MVYAATRTTEAFDGYQNANFNAHATVGDKAKKFIPMKRELSDEDFERRVIEHYSL